VAGGGLAMAGAVFQALLRNPLAEPYVLGVAGGAAVGAVAALTLGLALVPGAVPAAALAGALGAIVLVLRIAVQAGRALDTRVLLLAGVVVGAFFNAVILLLLTLADVESFRSAVFWMMGSLAGVELADTLLLALYVLPAAVVLLALARPLNLLAIGEETALFLGAPVERVKLPPTSWRRCWLPPRWRRAASSASSASSCRTPCAWRGAATTGCCCRRACSAAARSCCWPTRRRAPWPRRRSCRWASSRRCSACPSSSCCCAGARGCERRRLRARGVTFRYPGGAGMPSPAWTCAWRRRVRGAARPERFRQVHAAAAAARRAAPGSGARLVPRPRADDWPRDELAREIGVVTQAEEFAFPITVRELVAMGRYAHLGAWRRESGHDRGHC
jgi:hypothetical protein